MGFFQNCRKKRVSTIRSSCKHCGTVATCVPHSGPTHQTVIEGSLWEGIYRAVRVTIAYCMFLYRCLFVSSCVSFLSKISVIIIMKSLENGEKYPFFQIHGAVPHLPGLSVACLFAQN